LRFPIFKYFRTNRASDLGLLDVIKYLTAEMSFNLKELYTGLQRLTLEDNFQSFKSTQTIGAGEEIAIRNKLGIIPTGKVILETNNNAVIDGDTENSNDFVYLKNPSGSSATVTALWLK